MTSHFSAFSVAVVMGFPHFQKLPHINNGFTSVGSRNVQINMSLSRLSSSNYSLRPLRLTLNELPSRFFSPLSRKQPRITVVNSKKGDFNIEDNQSKVSNKDKTVSIPDEEEDDIVLDSVEAIYKKLAKHMGVDISELQKDFNLSPEEEMKLIDDLNRVVEEEKRTGKWWGKNLTPEEKASFERDMEELNQEFDDFLEEIQGSFPEDSELDFLKSQSEDSESEESESEDPDTGANSDSSEEKEAISSPVLAEGASPFGSDEEEEGEEEEVNYVEQLFLPEDTVVLENFDVNIEASEEEVEQARDTLQHIYTTLNKWKTNPTKEEETELVESWSWNDKRQTAFKNTIEILTYFLAPDDGSLPEIEADEDEIVLTSATLRRIKGMSLALEMDEAGGGAIIWTMLGLSVEVLNKAGDVLEQIIQAGQDEVQKQEAEANKSTDLTEIAENLVAAEIPINSSDSEFDNVEKELIKGGAEIVAPGVALQWDAEAVEGSGGEEIDALSGEDIGLAAATLTKLAKKVKVEVTKKGDLAKLLQWDETDVRATRVIGAVLKKMHDLNVAYQGEIEENDDVIEIDGDDLEIALAVLDDLIEAIYTDRDKKQPKVKKLGISFDDLELTAAVLRQMIEEGEDAEEEELEEEEVEAVEQRLQHLRNESFEELEDEEEEIVEQVESPEKVVGEIQSSNEGITPPASVKPSNFDKPDDVVVEQKTILLSSPEPIPVPTKEVIPERTVHLEKWQLKKLVKALALGKRNVNIKALAGETGLPRRDVLAFLANPPPGLDQLDLGLDEGPVKAKEKGDRIESEVAEGRRPLLENKPKGNSTKTEESSWTPTVQQQRNEKKKLSREHEETLEKVFRKTRYPTGTMIASLVDLTHLSKKRILEWFSERRSDLDNGDKEEGLPTVEPVKIK